MESLFMRRRWISVSLATSLTVLGIVICVWNTVIPGSTLFPDWSPDGKRLAFECNYPFLAKGRPNELRDYGVIEKAMEICVKTLDRSGFTRLTHDRAYDRYPVWSPDGTRIAFLSTDDLVNYESNIHIVDVESKQVSELPLPFRSVRERLSWSPTGQELCFAAGAPSGLRQSYTELYVANLASGSIRKLTELGGDIDLPTWSPDGKWIAFSWGVSEPADNTMVRLISADGSDERILAEGFWGIVDLAWSPNGQELMFLGASSATEEALYVIRMADGSLQNLTSTYEISRIHERVAWISEGRQIAFVGALAGQNPSVLSINRKGGDLVELADSLSGYQHAWTQDSKLLAFVRKDDRRNRHHIWIMDSENGSAEEIMLGLPR